jgi:hypothetical protein
MRTQHDMLASLDRQQEHWVPDPSWPLSSDFKQISSSPGLSIPICDTNIVQGLQSNGELCHTAYPLWLVQEVVGTLVRVCGRGQQSPFELFSFIKWKVPHLYYVAVSYQACQTRIIITPY